MRLVDWARSGNDIFVRLDPGDEIHHSLRSLCEEAEIGGAAVTSGIGRVRELDIGYLGADRVYQHKRIDPPVELLSLQGNIAWLDGEPFTHLHTVVSDDDHIVHGGHLFSAVTEVTMEIHMRVMQDVRMIRCEVENSDFKALGFQ